MTPASPTPINLPNLGLSKPEGRVRAKQRPAPPKADCSLSFFPEHLLRQTLRVADLQQVVRRQLALWQPSGTIGLQQVGQQGLALFNDQCTCSLHRLLADKLGLCWCQGRMRNQMSADSQNPSTILIRADWTRLATGFCLLYPPEIEVAKLPMATTPSTKMPSRSGLDQRVRKKLTQMRRRIAHGSVCDSHARSLRDRSMQYAIHLRGDRGLIGDDAVSGNAHCQIRSRQYCTDELGILAKHALCKDWPGPQCGGVVLGPFDAFNVARRLLSISRDIAAGLRCVHREQ